MTNARDLARGALTVTGSRILGLVISLVQVKLIVSYLGPTNYGLLLTATMFISSVSAFAQLGTGQIVVRWVSSRGADLEEMVGYALSLAMLVAVPLFIGVNVAGSFLYSSTPTVVQGVMILSLGLLASSWANALVPIAQVRGRFGHYALADILGRVISIALVLVAIATQGSLHWFYAAQLLGPLGQLAAMLSLAHSDGSYRPRWKSSTVKRLVIETVPLTYIAAVGTVYYTIDGVMLSKLSSPEQVGAYGLSYRIVDSFMIVSTSISAVLASRFAADAARGAEFLASTIKGAVRGVLLVAAPLAVLVWNLAPELIAFVGSREMIPLAERPLGLVSIGVGIGMVSGVVSTALIADYKQGILTWLNTFGLGLNVVLNFFLIPRFAATGAGMSLVASEGVALCIVLVLMHRAYGVLLPWGAIVRLIPALLLGLLTEHLLADATWYLRILGVGTVYGVAVLVMRVVTIGELKQILGRGPVIPEDEAIARGGKEPTP